MIDQSPSAQSSGSNLPGSIHQPSLPNFIHDDMQPEDGMTDDVAEGKAIFAQVPSSTGAPLRMTAANQPLRTTSANQR